MSTDTEDVPRQGAGGDDAVQRADSLVRSLGDTISTAVARAREEAEDIWAEAREISRGRFGRGGPQAR